MYRCGALLRHQVLASEEVDISILNDSEDPRLRRESAILLAECRKLDRKVCSLTSPSLTTKLTTKTKRKILQRYSVSSD